MSAMPQSLSRRRFLATLLAGALPGPLVGAARSVTLFFAGDVMTGRGIDQILPHPAKPHLFEPYIRSALGYVELAERSSGSIERPVDPAYIWGDALSVLEAVQPAACIVNLETAVTAAEDPWPGKSIHYRMHPANAPCLAAAKIDCCVLANNHVLDWGYRGLGETLDTLRAMGVRTTGAGRDAAEAAAPAALELAVGARVLVFAFGMPSAGVPREWAATQSRPGVNFLDALSARSVEAVSDQVHAAKRPGDIAVVSLHWGGNWGYAVSSEERRFARELIDRAGVDVVHGHSSHHPKGIEVHAGRPILYGCGDLLNDYEGIGGYESYRPDIALMYFPSFDTASGRLRRFTLTPMQIRRLRVNRAPEEAARWLAQTLNREWRRFGTRAERQADGSFALHWA